jgi:Na+:H+ antiporter, NhaA family
LIGCTTVALIWANSPWAGSYFHLWHTDLPFGFADARLSQPLHFWINDGLMALFFLLVGLEIKRETLVGELASFQKAALPIAAALGGMIVPAALYVLFNHGGPGASGWGIPMATDIAFALGVLALLGERVPVTLKVFLAALAIADDIGAVLVIAFFYTEQISWISLGVGGLFLAALITANRAGVRHPLVYALLGLGLWMAFSPSGIHATVAGVLLATTIPARQRADRSASPAPGESPMLRFEHALMPWNKYLIMPIFALANAGVVLGAGAARSLVDPISLGVICGLVLGKPIGIVLFSWLATQCRIATMFDGVSWRQVLGVGMLGGIGFTMSLFIANLAFDETPALETAKVGILTASVASAIAGAVVLARGVRHPKAPLL